jgi:hypothetical protein
MTTQPKPSETAIVGMLTDEIIKLRDENKRLRTTLAECGNAVGGIVGPQCTIEFLECVSQEVRLVTERLRREHAAAHQAAERAREERNRVGVEIRREWMTKTADVCKERDHWKANHDAQVSRARFLIERGDIPLERVRAYEEMAALKAFHAFFNDRCEGLFAQFGMPAIDAYNTAATGALAPKDPL